MEKKKNFFKKFLILSILTVLFWGLLPNSVTAEPLVPCGGEGQDPCELCHLFVLFDNIVKFVLRSLVPPIAALMLVIGGGMFFAAAGDPSKVGKAKSVITSVAIGLVIVYGAYLLINLFFWAIGVADWTGLENWFIYPCEPST
jgi:hypothetical protein